MLFLIALFGTSPYCNAKKKSPIGNDMKTPEEVFGEIYKKNVWGDSESKSGEGSNIAVTEELRKQLPKLFAEFKISSILDIPCGDFNWMNLVDLGKIHYIGADIVKSLIESNQQKFGTEQIEFRHLDAIKDSIPKVDIILCRDMLVHLTHAQIKQVLRNFKKSGSTYLLVTSQVEILENIDIPMGWWRKINFEKFPYNFPKPLYTIDEKSTQKIEWDKRLLLWRLEDIPDDFSDEIILKSTRKDYLNYVKSLKK